MIEKKQGASFAQLLAAVGVLDEALGRAAQVQIQMSRSAHPPDVTVWISRRDEPHSAYLSLLPPGTEDERNALDPVYVMRRVPPNMQARWRAIGQSFIDLSGTVFLHLPWLLIDKKIKPAKTSPASTAHADPFADRASLITRALLETAPGESWGVRELAARTTVSLGSTSKIIRTLEENGSVTVLRTGRNAAVSVKSPRGLFRDWATRYDWNRNPALGVGAPIADAAAFCKKLPALFRRALPGSRWALTLQAGASLAAPHAAWDRIHIYLDVDKMVDLHAAALALGWQPHAGGRLVLARPFYRRSLWPGVRKLEGLPTVSNLQLALDLWRYPVRGREQAEYLMSRHLPWILDTQGDD